MQIVGFPMRRLKLKYKLSGNIKTVHGQVSCPALMSYGTGILT